MALALSFYRNGNVSAGIIYICCWNDLYEYNIYMDVYTFKRIIPFMLYVLYCNLLFNTTEITTSRRHLFLFKNYIFYFQRWPNLANVFILFWIYTIFCWMRTNIGTARHVYYNMYFVYVLHFVLLCFVICISASPSIKCNFSHEYWIKLNRTKKSSNEN